MEQLSKQTGFRRRRSSGFTLIELIVVIGIMAILSAVALPSFMQWRNSIAYRQTASDMTSMLKRAKSDAISSNREYCVEVNQALGRFLMRRGDVSVNVNWDDHVKNPMPVSFTEVPSQVAIVPIPQVPPQNPFRIQFEPNGTVKLAGTVLIREATGAPRYWVDVAQSGRIRVCTTPCP